MNHGGPRPGAGRKAKPLKVLRKAMAEEILGANDEVKLWTELIQTDDLRIRLDALKYLTDRRDGRAVQAITHAGESGGPVIFQIVDIGAAKKP